ncbi:MAG TPA: DUF1080 domain-containing protein [Planctomycetota bacterium]
MLTAALLFLVAALGQQAPAAPAPTLHALERDAGWRSLFDGRSLAGWKSHGSAAPVQGWEVRDGCLVRTGAGGDLVTIEEFGDFELEFEFRLAAGTNSGVKYRVQERAGQSGMLGPEYQLLDDAAHPATAARHRTAALYDVLAPAAAPDLPVAVLPAGTWNHARIVAQDGRIEHWLNGIRVIRADTGGAAWAAARAASKFAGAVGFAEPARGRIGLQDHGGEAWFRRIHLRELDKLPGTEVALFAGAGTAGWGTVGDAVWTRLADGGLHGEVGGGAQSFLVSDREFADFLFEVDVTLHDRGNSGIQVRSHMRPQGGLFGYQIEIDPSPRAWSAGLYDEDRRGWLDDLADRPQARAAFRMDGPNRFRVECVGPWIRTWIDGVPAADHFDPLDLSGALGFQVHSGRNTSVDWTGLRFRDLGRRAWRPAVQAGALHGFEPQRGLWTIADGVVAGSADAAGPPTLATSNPRGDISLRARVRANGGALRIGLRLPGAAMPAAEPGSVGEPPFPEVTLEAAGGGSAALRLPGSAPEWRSVHVQAYGSRLVVHVDGSLLLDRMVEDLRPDGQIVFALQGGPGATLELADLAFLEKLP